MQSDVISSLSCEQAEESGATTARGEKESERAVGVGECVAMPEQIGCDA